MDKMPRKYLWGVPTFYGLYEDEKNLVMTRGGKTWNENTIRQYDRIILEYIVPNLKNHDQKRISDYSAQDFDNAMQQIVRKGKNKSTEDFSSLDDDTLNKFRYLMGAVVWAGYKLDLCENIFDEAPSSGAQRKWLSPGEKKIHQKKSLSISQERKVIQYLTARIFDNGLAVGLLLMFGLGLRNNEACGVNFGYIREFREYPGHYYIIIPQTTDLGRNTVKILGKTKNSGRKVPLPEYLVKILSELRNNRAQKAIAAGCVVDDLPIVCKQKKFFERASADDLSQAAKDMFLAIGMRREEIIELNHELLEESAVAKDELEEDEFREIEANPTAYLLRRNFATHLAILGLRDVEIWYVIGHKIEDDYVKRRSFSDEKLLFGIKQKLDQRPLLNPLIMDNRIQIQSGETVPLEGTKKIMIEIPVEQLHKVKINVTAKEPGDEIVIRLKEELDSGEVRREMMTYAVPEEKVRSRTIDGTRFYRDAYGQTKIDYTALPPYLK